MTTSDSVSLQWRKSSRSGEEGGQCVEVAVVEGIRVTA
ncbi:MAG: DUF397 domain-containing protein [Actinoallomurus sp.]